MRCRSFTRMSLCCLLVIGWAAVAQAAIKLPAVIGDNMVLQRGQVLPIWGWATAGDQVTVTLAGQTATAKVDANGYWRVNLAKLEAGGPLEMTVKDTAGTTIVIKNILVGEVWVASGQSNMEWPMAAVKDAPKELPAANYPQIRLFNVMKARAVWPAQNLIGDWTACTPQSVPGFSAVAYFFGRKLHKDLNVPIGLINTVWGGTPAEFWTKRQAMESNPVLKPFAGGDASSLYNAMVAPLMPYAIRGAIWYQGESNVGGAFYYRTLFPTMIANWRSDWGQGDFPFGFVQIAPWESYGKQNGGSAMAELQEAQAMTLKTSPNTGMAVITDIGDLKDIHPKNKQDVGHRLALWALAKVYGQNGLVYSGPMYKSMTVEGNKIRLQFDHAGSGLAAGDGKPLSEFTIAGADKNFVPAVAEIDGPSVVVHSDKVAQPAAVRYSWRSDATPNLANKEGLPASPFRTDTWKGVTQP
jgi:sialate O-acetylesterase